MGEHHIGDAMKQFVNKSKLKNGIRAIQIEEIWQTLMGPTIARYTEKIEIINDTVFITTYVGPLKQELMYQKVKIMQRINEAMNENIIREVIIQ